jgi:hypothetical protein
LRTSLSCLLIVCALVACQPSPPVEPGQTPATPPDEAQDPEAQDLDTRAPVNALSVPPEEVPTEQSQEEATLALPPPVDDDPDRFIGATPATLIAELGEPRLRRQESPAEVWQYRAQGCVLDLFLYEETQVFKVVHLEARDASAQSVETRSCLRSLLEARQASQSG